MVLEGSTAIAFYKALLLLNSVGPNGTTDYTFPNLSAGNYTINVTTTDGCSFSVL
jgi:hypothetical protein